MEKLFFLFITFFIRIYSNIKNNPIFLVEGKYPIVLSTTNDDYYYVITDKTSLKIEKRSGKISNETKEVIHTSSDSLFITDNLKNNYLVNDANKCFYIIYDPFISSEVSSFPSINFNNIEEGKKIGSIVQNNDIIIYGYYANNLFFSSKSQQLYCSIKATSNITDKLACKFIEGESFICAHIIKDVSGISLLNYHIDKENSLNNKLEPYSGILLNYENISEVTLYDTPKDNIKILCLKISYNIECIFVEINVINNDNQIKLMDIRKIIFPAPNVFSENNCYVSEFNYEFLFCCAITDCIFCNRIDNSTLNLIGQYKLNILGNNSHLTIKNNYHFITFFFMNYYENKTNIFEYYIYLPICQNKKYIILNSINWNKSNNDKERLDNLFKVETNNYYFKLINPPDDYGYFTLNNIRIEENEKILILDNNYILDFFVTNKDIDKELIFFVNYTISFGKEEAYSKECLIEMIIMPCYNTCETCSKNRSVSNEKQHNCIKCKNNYFPSPLSNGNCNSIEEKEINWYLDKNRSIFAS